MVPRYPAWSLRHQFREHLALDLRQDHNDQLWNRHLFPDCFVSKDCTCCNCTATRNRRNRRRMLAPNFPAAKLSLANVSVTGVKDGWRNQKCQIPWNRYNEKKRRNKTLWTYVPARVHRWTGLRAVLLRIRQYLLWYKTYSIPATWPIVCTWNQQRISLFSRWRPCTRFPYVQ